MLASAANLSRLENALSALKAENIYVPPLEKKYLDRGHTCHFICGEGAAAGIRKTSRLLTDQMEIFITLIVNCLRQYAGVLFLRTFAKTVLYGKRSASLPRAV